MSIFTRLTTRYPKFCGYLLGEFPFQEIRSSPSSHAGFSCPIPLTIYQTWEEKKLGKTHHREWLRFREMNPEFEFVIMDQPELDDYMASAWGSHPIHTIYRESRFGPMKVDIFRYCLIYDRGGFYFDINKGLNIPLRNFLNDKTDALISYEHDICHIQTQPNVYPRLLHPHHFLLNWGFGFVRHHIALKRTIDNICTHYPSFKGQIFNKPSKAVVKFTGPNMLTNSLHETLLENSEMTINQAGINFDGHGVTSMKRSWARYATAPTYTRFRDCELFQPAKSATTE